MQYPLKRILRNGRHGAGGPHDRVPYMATRLRGEQAPIASGDLAGDKRTREEAGVTETKNDGIE